MTGHVANSLMGSGYANWFLTGRAGSEGTEGSFDYRPDDIDISAHTALDGRKDARLRNRLPGGRSHRGINCRTGCADEH